MARKSRRRSRSSKRRRRHRGGDKLLCDYNNVKVQNMLFKDFLNSEDNDTFQDLKVEDDPTERAGLMNKLYDEFKEKKMVDAEGNDLEEAMAMLCKDKQTFMQMVNELAPAKDDADPKDADADPKDDDPDIGGRRRRRRRRKSRGGKRRTKRRRKSRGGKRRRRRTRRRRR